jgi:hypothetical protein
VTVRMSFLAGYNKHAAFYRSFHPGITGEQLSVCVEPALENDPAIAQQCVG